MRTHAARLQRERCCKHRGQAVTEKDQIDEAPADRLSREQRILVYRKLEHDGRERQRRDRERSHVMHYTVGAQAQPFESDRHGEADRYLQRDLGKARAVAVDVAVMDEVADFKKRQQHGEHDGAGIDHACGCVVGAAA